MINPNELPPADQPAPAPKPSVSKPAHVGRDRIKEVIRKVAPFLFREKKDLSLRPTQPASPASLPEKAPVRMSVVTPVRVRRKAKRRRKKAIMQAKSSASPVRVKRQKSKKKRARTEARPVRQAHTSLVVRKETKPRMHDAVRPSPPAISDAGQTTSTRTELVLPWMHLPDDGTKQERLKELEEVFANMLEQAQSDLDEKKRNADRQSPAQRPARKFLGGFLLKKKEATAAPSALMPTDVDESEAWMKRVKNKKATTRDVKKADAWSLVRDRFFSFGKQAKTTVSERQPAMTEREATDDSFLRRIESKKESAPVGTVVDEEETVPASAAPEEASALELFAAGKEKGGRTGKIVTALEIKKEEENAKRTRNKSAQVTRKEMEEEEKGREASATKEKEVQKQEEKPVPHVKIVIKKKSGFRQFLASLSHIGMGKERMLFVQNMAMMLGAGLPLIDAIGTLQAEARGKAVKNLLQRIHDTVENGSPFWKAMDAQDFFSLHAIALVRIGEEAGNLAENMARLAEQEEKDHALRARVKMAMIYPAIVLSIMFVIVMGLGIFVLPNLIGVLLSLNVPLPFVTRMVVAFSNLFSTYGYIIVPGSLLGIFVFGILAKFTPLKVVVQAVMFRIPGMGRLAREATIARFGVILGGLLKAGVPVIEAMQSLVEVTPIVSYRKLYMRMLEHLIVGDSFSKSFSLIKGSQKLLPPSVQQLVSTGERSGSLSDIMLKIADIYDKKASDTAQKLPVILEPMLLLFIGALVGTIAFAIIVPIYSIVGNVGRS